MSKRHDALYGDVLKGLDDAAGQGGEPRPERPTRFLNRSNTLADQASGQRQEKLLRLVDPAACVMWDRHNRAYALLTEENCRDLIDGILSQGQQEFPAIVRRLPEPQGEAVYEVICGARRHFAISWLRANNYPQFRYLVEERELTDEEAFRLADIENRDREDISDYERAADYLKALDSYYGGKQAAMAERLKVSATWLSRYLDLARLDPKVVEAFGSPREVKELYARKLKPLMADAKGRAAIRAEAREITVSRRAGEVIPPAKVLSRLVDAAVPPKPRKVADKVYRYAPESHPVSMRRKGKKVTLEFDKAISQQALRAAVERYLEEREE